MAQRISVETKQKIAALYAEGHSGCKIAKIVGVSAASVCRVIKFKSEPAKSFRPAVPQGFKSLQAAVATAVYCKSIGFDSEESITICRRIGCGVDEMKNLAKWRSERDLK
ncbi:helix-turn-helix domain-containing protein, partial [Anaerobiospirillum succiniciproducens]|uniref:helix-turn-helix domain-containing protein n=1 Tax=Anaerobiospirillum succiniciproducens TaxID=13335 RepID=UPI003F888F94